MVFDFGKHAESYRNSKWQDISFAPGNVAAMAKKLCEKKEDSSTTIGGATVRCVVDDSIPKDEIRINGIPVKFIPSWTNQ